MTLKGDLETVDLPGVMGMVAENQKTGIFTVRRGMEEKKLYFKKGRLIFASSTNENEKLGEVLQSNGLISRDKLLEVRKEQSSLSSQRLGMLFLEKGLISHDDLVSGLKAQVNSIILSLLEWWGGNFEFVEGDIPLPGGISVGFDLKGIILKATDSADEWNRVRSRIPKMEGVPRLCPSLPSGGKKVTISDEQWAVASQIDGLKTVEELCYLLPFPDLHTCKLIVALQDMGLVEEELSGEVEQTDEFFVERMQLKPLIHLFNEILRFIHRRAFDIDRNRVRDLLESAYLEVAGEEASIFEGVNLASDGSLDADILTANALTIHPDFRLERVVGALSSVVRRFVEVIEQKFGKKERDSITKEARVVVDFVLHQNRNILQRLGIKEDVEVALGT